jgi:hypothetical protein
LTYAPDIPEDDGARCILRLKIKDGKLVLDDVGLVCRRFYCGARGGFNGDLFDLKKRRDSAYMDRLKASRQFQDALKAYNARHP